MTDFLDKTIMSKHSLAYRIAKKLIDNGYLLRYPYPDDYEIVRTRAGRHQLAAGAFSWELVHKIDGLCRYGCYEPASYIVKKSLVITHYSYTGDLIIDEQPLGVNAEIKSED